MRFRYLKYKDKIKQMREVEINSLIDYLKLNNIKNQTQDYLNKTQEVNNDKHN